MGLVELKCSSCGANLVVNNEDDVFVCEFCGTKLTFEKIRHEISGTIKIDGIAGVEEMLDRASILLKNSQFAKASALCEKILEIAPRCAEAYWIKFLCNYLVSDPQPLVDRALDITNNQNYKLAVDFSEGAEKEFYVKCGDEAAEAHRKFILRHTRVKKFSRMIFFLSFSISILALLIFIYIESVYEELLPVYGHDKMSSYEAAPMPFGAISSFIAAISNTVLVSAKRKLGEDPVNILRYILWALFVAASLGCLMEWY